MTQRLAYALLRHYPLAWRERYEAEVCALIDDSSMRFRDLAELVRGLLTERARELVSSEDRPKRTLLILSLIKPICVLISIGLAAVTGMALRQLSGPWSERAQEITGWGLMIFVIVFVATIFRTRVRPLGSHPPYPAWAGMTLLPCLFVALTLFVASGLGGPSPSPSAHRLDWISRYSPWFNWWIYMSIASDLASSLWPAQRLLWAFAAVPAIGARIKAAQQWVDSCHEWIAKGVPSPLADAEKQLAEPKRELEDARDRLHSLGYRARFRQHLGRAASA